MENKRVHLKMIQGIINRLSQNSFLLKGWSVVIVSVMFALAANNSETLFIYLAFFPAFAFWVLDGYFLWQERLFRELYDHVRGLKEEEIDFSMDTSRAKGQSNSWFGSMFSKTLIIFHGTLFALIILALVLVNILNNGG